MHFKGKLINQTWENDKKPTFGPDFGAFLLRFGLQKLFLWVLHLLDVAHCCKLSLYVISRKTNESNLRKWPDFNPFGQNLGPKNFFRGFYFY